MADLNKVFLIGRLTADPELSYTDGGTAKTKFRLATNRVYKNASGEKIEDVVFVPVVCWSGCAETVAKYMEKGRMVHVEGRLSIYSYDDAEGNKKTWTEVVAQGVQFLDRNPNGAGGGNSAPSIPAGNGEPVEVPF